MVLGGEAVPQRKAVIHESVHYGYVPPLKEKKHAQSASVYR